MLYQMLSKQDKSFLNIAIKAAELSTMRQRHAAVIVKSGRVLAIAVNSFRSHPCQTETDRIKSDCSLHAEVAALKRVKNSRGCTLFVARINNGSTIRYSKPCLHCEDAIEVAGIKRVVYTTDEMELV